MEPTEGGSGGGYLLHNPPHLCHLAWIGSCLIMLVGVFQVVAEGVGALILEVCEYDITLPCHCMVITWAEFTGEQIFFAEDASVGGRGSIGIEPSEGESGGRGGKIASM